MALSNRTGLAGTSVLMLDGVNIGLLHGVSGGEHVGSVATTDLGTGSPFPKKHITQVAIQPLEITFGLNVDARLLRWVADWLEGRAGEKNGSIVFADHDLREQARIDFTGARIGALGLPSLDASSRETLRLSLTLHPTTVVRRSGDRGAVAGTLGTRVRTATLSQFRFMLGSLDTTRVATVELPDVKAQLVRVDEDRLADTGVSGRLDASNLVCTLAESAAAGWLEFGQRFLVEGRNADGDELVGRLEVLASDLRTVLMTVVLGNVGVVRMATLAGDAGAEAVKRVRAEFYCERVQLTLPADAAAGSTPVRQPEEIKPFDPKSMDTDTLVKRLRSSPASSTAVDATQRRREQGQALGALWAAEHATLPELQALAALEPRAWAAISLPEGHSLTPLLKKHGVLPAVLEGAVEIKREPLTEGLVSGAAEVLRRAAPKL